MKRQLTLLVALTVSTVLLLTSCDKDAGSSEKNDRVTFTGIAESIGVSTRAHNAYSYDVLWDGEEKIYVKNGDRSNTFTLVDGVGTPNGKFTEDGTPQGIKGEIEAFYPATLKTDDGYVWPAVQVDDQVGPMYAKQTITGKGGEIVNFSSLGAMLQIIFNSTTPGIVVKSITLKHKTKPMSGKFTVDASGQAVLSCTDTPDIPGITLDLGEGVELGTSAKDFYIAIPSGEYNGEDMAITFYATDGKVCEMKSNAFHEVKRNTAGCLILSGEFKEITHVSINGHESVKLAGYYWATENVGEVEGYDFYDATYGYYYTQDKAITAAASWNEGNTSVHEWTLPSSAQWQALIDGCNWTRKTGYSIGGKTMNGYLVSDKKYPSDFIFLPSTGNCLNYSGYTSYRSQGRDGYYWSSDQRECLYADWSTHPYMGSLPLGYVVTVRLVSK